MSFSTECSGLAAHATATEFTILSCALFAELSSIFYGRMKFNDFAAHLCWMSSCCIHCAINLSLTLRLAWCVSWVFTKEAAPSRNIEGCWPAHSWLAQGSAGAEGCELFWRCCWNFWQCVSAQIWKTRWWRRWWRRWRELSRKLPGCEFYSQSIVNNVFQKRFYKSLLCSGLICSNPHANATYKCLLLIRPAAQAERQKRWRSKLRGVWFICLCAALDFFTSHSCSLV